MSKKSKASFAVASSSSSIDQAAKAELRERIAKLYRTKGDKLRALAFRVLCDHADAEDAVQDAFVEALEVDAIRDADPEAYVAAIVRRACRDRLRIRSAELELIGDPSEEGGDGPEVPDEGFVEDLATRASGG